MKGHTDVVEILLEAGSEVNTQDKVIILHFIHDALVISYNLFMKCNRGKKM